MAVALRFIGLLLLLALGACVRTEVHPDVSRGTPRATVADRVSEYTVRPGDTVYSIARRFGIDYRELARRNRLGHPYTIHPGQQLRIGTASSRSESWVYKVRSGDTLYSIAKRVGIDYHLLASRNHLPYPYTIYVGQELHLAGVAPRSISLPGVRDVPAAAASSASTKGGKPQATAKAVYPIANGSAPKLLWPINGIITSGFGSRGSRMHDGVDIGAPAGTPVRAAADGEVVYSDQRLSGYGKLIILRHSGDVFTAYAHNQRNLVSKGDRVKQGDVIARVGQTGRASGPHLHFEVRRGSTPVDPLAYLPRR